VSLQGNGKFEITQTKYRLTEEQKHEDGEKLFDFCAECLQTFIKTNMSNVTEPGEEPKPGQDNGEEAKEGLIKPGQELALGFTVSGVQNIDHHELTSHGSSLILARTSSFPVIDAVEPTIAAGKSG
jgi:hexokinase